MQMSVILTLLSCSCLTVCKPCLDGWVLFQLSCYLFVEYQYYYYWKSWEGSRENCRQMKADLVVIESREEQVRWILFDLEHLQLCLHRQGSVIT